MDRRQYLALVGAGGIATVAGCLGDDNDGDDDPDNDSDDSLDDDSDNDSESAYGITAAPFPSFPIGAIDWSATGDSETGFTQFVFADNDRRAESVQALGFNGN